MNIFANFGISLPKSINFENFMEAAMSDLPDADFIVEWMPCVETTAEVKKFVKKYFIYAPTKIREFRQYLGYIAPAFVKPAIIAEPVSLVSNKVPVKRIAKVTVWDNDSSDEIQKTITIAVGYKNDKDLTEYTYPVRVNNETDESFMSRVAEFKDRVADIS